MNCIYYNISLSAWSVCKVCDGSVYIMSSMADKEAGIWGCKKGELINVNDDVTNLGDGLEFCSSKCLNLANGDICSLLGGAAAAGSVGTREEGLTHC